MAAGALVATSCARAETPESLTPEITAPAPSELDLLLLRESDLEDVGLSDLVRREVGSLDLYENPDLRGPCGAELTMPSLAGGAIVAFASADEVVVEMVLVRDDDVDALVRAFLADVRDPCGPFESMTNQGLVQEVRDIRLVDLGGDVEGIGFLADISVADLEPVPAAVAVVGLEDYVLLVQGSSPGLTEARLRTLADRAVERASGA